MSDDNDLRLSSNIDRANQIERYQQLQEQQQQQAEQSQKGDDDAVRAREQQMQGGAGDVQGQVEAQRVAEVNESREVTGSEQADSAVDAANAQQDRAEQWQDYSQVRETQVPPSLESNPAEPQSEQVNIGDLMNQMKIQGGKIGA